MKRERLGSRLGFIFLSAGCAIGVGNVWKFPYMAGQYGGGAFVLLYLFFLVIMGIPVLTMEFSLGRASQKSPVRIYQQLAPAGSKWHLHSYAIVAGNYLLMMFYTTVAGWMVKYFFSTAAGDFDGMSTQQVSDYFAQVCANPGEMLLFTGIVVLVGFFICSFSLQKGLERVTKYMMSALLVLMVVLVINSFTMPGAKEGLTFYLKPDLSKMQEAGVVNVIAGAMTQAFFTLSLGMGGMAIFGSYIERTHSLLGEAIHVTILDTLVALMAGLIIFPACFTHGVSVTAGPPLIFEILPNIFNHMSMGRLWGSLFFLFMIFAALSTVLGVFENILAMCMDLFGWNRKKACLINCILMLFLAAPCALGFNVLAGFHPLGGSTNILDLEDFLVSNLILPIGSLIFILFCTQKSGWGWDSFTAEANAGKGPKVKNWMRGYMTYVLPVVMIVVLAIGLINYFI